MGALDRVFRSRRPSQERPLAAIIAGLWRSGEQGVWYDPSNLSTMFQDAAGTLPCYMPGQGLVDPPVGLLLDKRFDLVGGSERIPGGVWASGSQAIITDQSDYGFTAETGAGDNFATAYKTISGLVPGRMYRLAGQFSAGVSGTAIFRVAPDVGSAPGALVDIAVGTGSVTVSRVFTATAASIQLGVALGSHPVRVTAAGLSVKEIPGNHAYQTTTTSRPTLSARYNLLTSSENLASTWSVFNGSFSAVGGYWKFTENASANLHSFLQTPSQPKAASYRASFVGKPAGRSMIRFVLNAYSGNFAEVRFNLATGSVAGVFTGGDGVVESYSIVPVEDGAYRCTIVGKPSAAATGTAFDVSLGMMDGMSSSYTGDGASGILVNYFDCRSANDGVGLPPYQRVVDASTYDTAGFPLYLKFDGVDDSLLTADIDFSTVSSAIAVSAVRKLSDASRGIVFELGGTGYSSPGSFNQEIMWFSANVSTSYSGATGNATSTYPCIAPFSAVMSSAWNLSAPLQTFRVNGVLRSTSTVAVGGGMFQKAPLFIGRRNNSSVPFNGRLYGLIVRSGATPDATITRIERYLNSKARAY